MRIGTLYCKRTKLGPTLGRTCQDWPAPVRDGWVLYWYKGHKSAERWNLWRLHFDRVWARQMEPQGRA